MTDTTTGLTNIPFKMSKLLQSVTNESVNVSLLDETLVPYLKGV